MRRKQLLVVLGLSVLLVSCGSEKSYERRSLCDLNELLGITAEYAHSGMGTTTTEVCP